MSVPHFITQTSHDEHTHGFQGILVCVCACVCFTIKQCCTGHHWTHILRHLLMNELVDGWMNRWVGGLVSPQSPPGPCSIQVGHLLTPRVLPLLEGGCVMGQPSFLVPGHHSRPQSLPEVLGLSHLPGFCLGPLASDKASGDAWARQGAPLASKIGARM